MGRARSPAVGDGWGISVDLKQDAEGDAVGEVGGEGDNRGLAAVVEATQPGRLQHRGRGSTSPVRRHPRVHAGEGGDEEGERDRDMQQPKQPAQPPGGPVQQPEAGGIAQGEPLPGHQMEEEPGDPSPGGVLGDDGAEQQRQVEPGQPGQLGHDHHRGQGGGGNEAEQRPASPVHGQRGASWRALLSRAWSTWANDWWKLATPWSSRVRPTSSMSPPTSASLSITASAWATPLSMVRAMVPWSSKAARVASGRGLTVLGPIRLST